MAASVANVAIVTNVSNVSNVSLVAFATLRTENVQTDEVVVFTNIMARNRGLGTRSETELRTETKAKVALWSMG
jgi:hypothetical protein